MLALPWLLRNIIDQKVDINLFLLDWNLIYLLLNWFQQRRCLFRYLIHITVILEGLLHNKLAVFVLDHQFRLHYQILTNTVRFFGVELLLCAFRFFTEFCFLTYFRFTVTVCIWRPLTIRIVLIEISVSLLDFWCFCVFCVASIHHILWVRITLDEIPSNHLLK